MGKNYESNKQQATSNKQQATRLLIFSLTYFLISIASQAQSPKTEKWQKWYEPGVRSEHDGDPATDPLSTSVNLIPEAAELSGEDWMYDIVNCYDANGNKDGYLMTGYTAHRNFLYFDPINCDPNTLNLLYDGYNGTPNLENLHCDAPNRLQIGQAMTNAMRIDESGNVLWFKVYGNHSGEMWDIKQSKVNRNHAYLCGRSNYYDKTSETYNPKVGGGHIVQPNDDCLRKEATSARKAVIAKIDINGNKLWEYTYGWEPDPMNPITFRPENSLYCLDTLESFIGRFWDMVELDNGDIIAVGCTSIPVVDANNNQLGPSVKGVTPMRCFIVKIDKDGQLLASKIFNAPTSTVPSGFFTFTPHSGCFAIEQINSNVFVVGYNNYIVLGQGLESIAGVFKIDANLNELPGFEYDIANHSYGTSVNSGTNFNGDNGFLMWDLVSRTVNGNLEILISGHSKEDNASLSTPYKEYYPSEGLIIKTNNNLNLSSPSSVSLGAVSAYDLMVKINLNDNNSVGIISSTHQDLINKNIVPQSHTNFCCGSNPPFTIPPSETRFYKSDALFGQINSTAFTLDWTNVVKDPMDQGSCYPDNFKKQLCMYNLVEADDGDWVAAGNNGLNLDAVHVIRVSESCESQIPNAAFNYLPDDLLLQNPIKSVQQHCINMGYGTSWTIGSSKTWKCQVIVENGYTLTLGFGSTQEFADIYKTFGQLNNTHYSIIVKDGGKLIVENNVTLTGMISCDGGWGGIKIEEGGELQLMNSTLENAFTAITSQGGKVTIENDLLNRNTIPNIYNCRRGVDILETLDPSTVKFKYAYFKNDAELSFYDGGLDFFVRLEDVHSFLYPSPVKFISCKFENTHFTTGNERVAGVLAMRTGMHFMKGGSSTIPFANENNQVCLVPNDPPNEFFGLKTGIWAHNLNVDQPTPVRILECDFKEVVNPITISGCRNALVYDNEIEWLDVQNKPILAGAENKLGINSIFSEETRIWENKIDNIENFDFRGIYTEQSVLPTHHYKNTINHTGSGNYGTGHQFSLDNEELDIQCEQYTSLQTDWHIEDGLLKEQGDQLPSGFHNTNNWSVSGTYKIEAYSNYNGIIYNNNTATNPQYYIFNAQVIPFGIINENAAINDLGCYEKDKCSFYSVTSGESDEYDIVAMVQKTPLEQIFDAVQNNEFEFATQQLAALENNERAFYAAVIPLFKNDLIRKEQGSVLSQLKGLENLQDRNVQRLAKDYLYFYNGVLADKSSIERRLREKRSLTEGETASTQKELADLKVYPNPTNKTLFIEDQTAHSSVEVYAQTGQQVLTYNPKNGKKYSIDVSQLPSGMYFIHITKVDNTRKVLKIAVH